MLSAGESGDAGDDQGTSITMISNILKLSSQDLSGLRKLASIILQNDPINGGNPLSDIAILLSDLYLQHPNEYSALQLVTKNYFKDQRVAAVDPWNFLKNVFGQISNQRGVGNLIGDLLIDPTGRGRVIGLGSGLARSHDFIQLEQLIVDLINSGDFEKTLHFIFDNFSPSSIKSM